VTIKNIKDAFKESDFITCTIAGNEFEEFGITDGCQIEVKKCIVPEAENVYLCSIDGIIRIIFFSKGIKNQYNKNLITFEDLEKLKNIEFYGIVLQSSNDIINGKY
jgi:hypothetical protein